MRRSAQPDSQTGESGQPGQSKPEAAQKEGFRIGWINSNQLSSLYQGVKYAADELGQPEPRLDVLKNVLTNQAAILEAVASQTPESVGVNISCDKSADQNETGSPVGMAWNAIQMVFRHLPQNMHAEFILRSK